MSRVLVIEDDETLRDLIACELRDAGHVVEEAADGAEGFGKVRAFKPDVICSDVRMPIMNGMLLKQRLEETGLQNEKVTFIFISGLSSKEDVANGLMLGAAHYFTKPLDFNRFLNVVANC